MRCKLCIVCAYQVYVNACERGQLRRTDNVVVVIRWQLLVISQLATMATDNCQAAPVVHEAVAVAAAAAAV